MVKRYAITKPLGIVEYVGGSYVLHTDYALLEARCEAAEKKAETLQRALDGSRAEVFRLADKLRTIDPEFQSPMIINKTGAP